MVTESSSIAHAMSTPLAVAPLEFLQRPLPPLDEPRAPNARARVDSG